MKTANKDNHNINNNNNNNKNDRKQNTNKNDVTIDFQIKTRLIMLTQQYKQSSILLSLSKFPLKLLQQALGIDEKEFLDNLDEESKKFNQKYQKFFKHQTLAILSSNHLLKIIKKDCKSSFKCWKQAQLVTYYNLHCSRMQQLNAEQQMEKIIEAESVLSPSNIGEEFLEEINYKILKLMFILEKIRVWVQMGDFIKSVKIFLVNEGYLEGSNHFQDLLAQDDIKQEERKKYQFFLYLKSQIYVTYAFTMQKVHEYKSSINAYQVYLKIRESILNTEFVSELFQQQDKQNSLYSLYLYFFYKYCKILVKDKQDEKALQSVCKGIFILNQLEENDRLKEQELIVFKKKFSALNGKIEELVKQNAIHNIHKQNELLHLQSLKYRDDQLKQIKILFKMSKQDEQEKKIKIEDDKLETSIQRSLNKSISEGNLIENKNNSRFLEIKTEKISHNNINLPKEALFENSLQINKSEQNKDENIEEKKKNSFMDSYQDMMLNSFLEDGNDSQKEQFDNDYLNKLYTDEEEQNIEQKYKTLIDKKEVDIKGLTKNEHKKMTPLNVLLAQNEIVMENFFNVKKFNTEYASNKEFHTEQSNNNRLNLDFFNRFENHKQSEKVPEFLQDVSPTARLMNTTRMNTSNQVTQIDSRRVSQLHSERYRNNSLFSQNSQLLASNNSKDPTLHLAGSGVNRWNMHFPNTVQTPTSKRTITEKTEGKQIQNKRYDSSPGVQRLQGFKLNLDQLKKDYDEKQQHPLSARRDSKTSIINQFKNKYVDVYANAYNPQQVCHTDRPRTSSNPNIRIQKVKKGPIQLKHSASNFKSTRTSPNRDNFNGNGGAISSRVNNTQTTQKLKSNYELIKDLDIEMELKYLMGKSKEVFLLKKNSQLNSKPELMKRPSIDLNDQLNTEYKQNEVNENQLDESYQSLKSISSKIPNIMNFLKQSKKNSKIEDLPQKYFNQAKTDEFIRKKLYSINFENLLKSHKHISTEGEDVPELVRQITQRNHFVTGLQKLPEVERNHIIKYGGVVYNETKEDFEYMNADKYGKGFMNSNLEEKLKSVKDELKKIEFIPPKPPTEIILSSQSETDYLDNVDEDLLNQRNAIVNRFKDRLNLEMEAINDTNLFVNHELINKQHQNYKIQYKSQFQRYVNKDFYVNLIAQHNITINKGGEEEEVAHNMNQSTHKFKTDDNQREISEQEEEEEQILSERQFVRFTPQHDEKRMSVSDYSYSLADNLSDPNKSYMSQQIIPTLVNMGKGGNSPRGNATKRQSVFLRQSLSLKPDFNSSDQQPPFLPVLQELNSNQELFKFQQTDTNINHLQGSQALQQSQGSQASKFQRFSYEKKLSIFIGEKGNQNQNEGEGEMLSAPSEESEMSQSHETPSAELPPSKGHGGFTTMYEDLEKDSLKDDLTSIRLIDIPKAISTQSIRMPVTQKQVQIDKNQEKRKSYQRKSIQRHQTFSEQPSPSKEQQRGSSPLYRKLSTQLILLPSKLEHDDSMRSPTGSPFTLQTVFKRFTLSQEDNIPEILSESPTKLPNIPTNLDIQIHFDGNEEDNPMAVRPRKFSEPEQQSIHSNSVEYVKKQNNVKESQFKLRLQNLSNKTDKSHQSNSLSLQVENKIIEQDEKTPSPIEQLIKPKLLQKRSSLEPQKKQLFATPQTPRSPKTPRTGQLHQKSCLKIQSFFRKYQYEKRELKQKLRKSIQLKMYLEPSKTKNQNVQFDVTTEDIKQRDDSQKEQSIVIARSGSIFKRHSQIQIKHITDIGIRNLIQARLFQQKIRESQSGIINNQSPFLKYYPPFKFTRLIQGVPVSWKVKHSFKKETFGSREINNYFMTILYGNTRFSIKVDLDYAGMELRGLEFSTLWPLYLVAFEKYLRDQNIKIFVTKPQNDIKNLPYPLSFFEGLTTKLKEQITDFDLNCVGNLKDLLEIYLKHFFQFYQKVNGQVLEYNKNQIFPQWKLIQVKKAQKKLDRFISMSIEGQKCHKVDYKKHKKEYEQALKQNERVLQNNLVRFIKENHLLGVFIKRSTGGYYYLLIVRVNFRQSNDIATQIVNGQLMLSDFSFYITGRNLGTFQTILPLEVHASQVTKYFKPNTLIREINKKRLSNRWIMILVNFFSTHLCLTLPKIDRNGVQSVFTSSKVQKLIFRDIMEIRRRIQLESQKQVLLQNPFNDFFLIEQMNRSKLKTTAAMTLKEKKISQKQQLQLLSKQERFEHITDDNFNKIYENFYKNLDEQQFEKNDYSIFHEDDELDKKYEEGYYQAHEEILRVPPQEEIIEDEFTLDIDFADYKVIKQGNQLRRKNNIAFSSQIDLQQQLEGFWRLSNLFGNGRCIRQKVFFSTLGTELWIRIQLDIIKGVMVVHILDYRQSVSFKQVIKNQKVRQNLINMTTLVPEEQADMNKKVMEKLRSIAFQGILELEKSLLGRRIKLKVEREEDTLKNPVLMNNKDSVKNHLLIDSIELRSHYDIDEYTSIFKHKELGKIICSIKTYIINKAIDQSIINAYLFRLSIQLLCSKHYQFKIILGFDDLFNLDRSLHTNLLRSYNKIYAQKLISLIMNRLQLVATVQGKVPCFLNSQNMKNISTESLPVTPRKQEQPNQNFGCLRFKRNRFTKQSYNQTNQQQQKTMLDDYMQQSRVIFHGIKKFSGEYCIVTVSKDILLRYWVFNIYVPKTCRVLVSYFNNSDMMDCSEEFLAQQMSQKIIYFFENPQMTPFKSYRDFIKRIRLQNDNSETTKEKKLRREARKKKTEIHRSNRNLNKHPHSSQEQKETEQKKSFLDLKLKVPITEQEIKSSSISRDKLSISPTKNDSDQKQQRQKVRRSNKGTRKSVLDLKFEFINFTDKFNDLREVFQPGIQKKKSMSSENLSSLNSQSSFSLQSPNLSPVPPKQRTKSKQSNVFNFAQQRQSAIDLPTPKHNLIQNQQQLQQQYHQQHQQQPIQSQQVRQQQLSTTNPKHYSFSQRRSSASQRIIITQTIQDQPIKKIQPIESRKKLMQKLKTQEQIIFKDNEQSNNSTEQKPKLSQYRINIDNQIIQKDDYINSKRDSDRRKSAVIMQRYSNYQQDYSKQQYSNPTFLNKRLVDHEPQQQNRKMSGIFNTKLQIPSTTSQKFLAIPNHRTSIQEMQKQSDSSSNLIKLNQIQSQGIISKSEEVIKKPVSGTIPALDESKNIIQENQKIVNQLFNPPVDRRASLMSHSRSQKQNIKSLYMTLFKSKAQNQPQEDQATSADQANQSIGGASAHSRQSKQLIKQKPKTSVLRERRGFQALVKKHFIKILVVIHFQQYIDMKRIGNKVKIQRTQKFFDLTKLLDDAFVSQQYSVRINNLCKFIEMSLWENLIAQSRLEADLHSEHMLFCFDKTKLPLHELMYHDFMQIEGNICHEFNTEICINFIDIVSNKGLQCKQIFYQNFKKLN